MPVSTSRAAHHPQPRPRRPAQDGGRFDLAIALGILAASGQLPGTALDGLECLGELALSGAIRPVRGVLPAALAARDARRVLVVPKENAEEASLASGLTVFAVDHLLEIAGHLSGQAPLPPYQARGLLRAPFPYPDLAEVQGQAAAKRALLVPPARTTCLCYALIHHVNWRKIQQNTLESHIIRVQTRTVQRSRLYDRRRSWRADWLSRCQCGHDP